MFYFSQFNLAIPAQDATRVASPCTNQVLGESLNNCLLPSIQNILNLGKLCKCKCPLKVYISNSY